MIAFDMAGLRIPATLVAHPAATAQATSVSEIADSAKARSSSEHSALPHSGQANNSAAESDQRPDGNTPIIAGPPPAFEASLLELEASIENAIKRVHEEREKARSGDVVKLDQASEDQPEPTIGSTAITTDQNDAETTP